VSSPRDLVRIRSVAPLAGFKLRLGLTDGRTIERDVGPLLGGPAFAAVREDRSVFEAVRVEGGTLVWPNDVDLCPDAVILGLRKWPRRQEGTPHGVLLRDRSAVEGRTSRGGVRRRRVVRANDRARRARLQQDTERRESPCFTALGMNTTSVRCGRQQRIAASPEPRYVSATSKTYRNAARRRGPLPIRPRSRIDAHLAAARIVLSKPASPAPAIKQ
jgi:hypothetical protein